ncbi:hypothetical protein SUDANB121_04378 [Nocardiopsis dassonvillei]|uniref:hypothetical protein n=1 Tax=Nocardiopsis dassonvillei TaxID=2014 RepID=UPI003F54637D
MRAIRIQSTGGIAVASVSVLALVACSSPSPSSEGAMGDYPSYASAQELFEAADLVVEATVEGSRTEPIDVSEGDGAEEGLEPIEYTVYTLAVSEVFEGRDPGGVLEVKHENGATDDLELREGETYVLFLATYDDVPASLLNPDQSVYLVGGDGELEPVGGTLEVTREDLG